MSPHRMSPHRLILATLCALAGGLVLSSVPASAFEGYVLGGMFGTAGSGNGQLSSPTGVAVGRASKDVYVVDQGNNRVERFSSAGVYELQFTASGALPNEEGKKAPLPLLTPDGIAVDNSTNPSDPSAGEVYVTDVAHGVIDKFSATGSFISQLKETSGSSAFGKLRGVAVDPEGNVWVYQGEGNVDEFSDSGGFVKQFNTGHEAKSGVAVDSLDNVYATRGGGNLSKYSSTGAELAEFGAGNTTALAIEPSTNNLFVDQEGRIEEFGPFGEPFSSPVATFPTAGLSPAGGLSGSYGIAATSNAGVGEVYTTEREAGKVVIFNEAFLAEVSTEEATGVSKTAATLNGTVNPDAVAVSACRFEYRTEQEASFAHTAECSPPAGSGSAPVMVSAALSLTAGTAYSYRLAATNANGTEYGSERSFTTLPAVEGVTTGPATNITASGATLTGSLEPNGLDTHYYFQYGRGISYGSTSPELPPGVDAGSVSEVTQAETTLSDLQAAGPYHYRLVAVNTYGTTYGQDMTFTVPAPVPPAPTAATGGTSGVSQTVATLTGAVTPGSVGANSDTTWYFQYGTDITYSTGSVPSPAGDAGAGTAPVAVATEAKGLSPNTTYHYRLVAVNDSNNPEGPPQTTEGLDQSLTTLPAEPFIGQPSDFSETAVTLNGSVDPTGADLQYHFQYGASTAYGQNTLFLDAGTGSTATAVSATLSGLTPGVTYHARLVSVGAGGGESYSADATFTLNPSAASSSGANPFAPGPSVFPVPASFPLLSVLPTPAVTPPIEPAPPKPLTRSQKLARALKACRAKRNQQQRASCESAARRKYGKQAKAKHPAKRGGRRP